MSSPLDQLVERMVEFDVYLVDLLGVRAELLRFISRNAYPQTWHHTFGDNSPVGRPALAAQTAWKNYAAALGLVIDDETAMQLVLEYAAWKHPNRIERPMLAGGQFFGETVKDLKERK